MYGASSAHVRIRDVERPRSRELRTSRSPPVTALATHRCLCGSQRHTVPASQLYSVRDMPTDLLTLLRRDHSDLQQELTALLDPTATVAMLRSSLDGVRLGLTAHAEAEDIVLGRFEVVPALQVVVAQARAAHLAQEG